MLRRCWLGIGRASGLQKNHAPAVAKVSSLEDPWRPGLTWSNLGNIGQLNTKPNVVILVEQTRRQPSVKITPRSLNESSSVRGDGAGSRARREREREREREKENEMLICEASETGPDYKCAWGCSKHFARNCRSRFGGLKSKATNQLK